MFRLKGLLLFALILLGVIAFLPLLSHSPIKREHRMEHGPREVAIELGGNEAGIQPDPGSEHVGLENEEVMARNAANAQQEAATDTVQAERDLRASFEHKYRGKSRLELEVALGALTPRVHDLLDKIVEERRKAGLATRVYAAEGETLKIRELTTTPEERSAPNPYGAFAGSIRGGGTDSSVEVVNVPHGVYPEFDALQAETGWLRDAIKQLR